MKKFNTEEEAIAWAVEYVDDPCVDNERFVFDGDIEGMERYDAKVRDGCCGEFDANVIVDGRLARVGCNYGH